MASEVDICNLALGNLGDTAEIASLTEASTQAQLCRKFYGPARDALLEMAAWGFSTRRAVLAELPNPPAQWQHMYSMPAGVLNVLAVIASNAAADLEVNFTASVDRPWPEGFVPVPGALAYTPQPYIVETAANGNQVILTNQCEAMLRYTIKITDTTKFSPLFTLALGWLLSSMLAGPILKGDAGRAEAKGCLAMAQTFAAKAEVSDANQVQVAAKPVVPWIAGR